MSYQQEKFKEIADKIREKTGRTDKIKPSEFAELQNDVFEAGRNAESKWFWDLYQDNGARTDYSTAFAGPCWSNELFKPLYDIHVSYSYGMFRSSAIEIDLVDFSGRNDITIDFSNLSNAQYTFWRSLITHIGEIGLASGGTFTQTFYSAAKLHTIEKLIVKSTNKFADTFKESTALENITVEGTIGASFDIHWSPLSKASIESIVSALSDTATGQTVTFNSDRIDALYTESEWASVVAAKPNWTFALL